MFSIEHEFDSTVITLVDEGDEPLNEDVVIRVYEDGAVVEQFEPETGEVAEVLLTLAQMRELAAALDLPEGVYKLALEE